VLCPCGSIGLESLLQGPRFHLGLGMIQGVDVLGHWPWTRYDAPLWGERGTGACGLPGFAMRGSLASSCVSDIAGVGQDRLIHLAHGADLSGPQPGWAALPRTGHGRSR
jgi:hypothetical protein